MPSLSVPISAGHFGYAAGTGDPNFWLAVNMAYVQDLNQDGIDEVIFSGFETQPNTPEKYSNTQIAIFGWKDGNFQNLTDQWLPNGTNKVEGVGDLSFGDFNGDGRIDIFLAAYADMEFPVTVFELLNQGSTFTKTALGKAAWQHDSASADINHDGYADVIAAGYGDSPRVYLGSVSGLVAYKPNDFMGGSGVALGDFLGDGTTSMILVDHTAATDTVLYKFKFNADKSINLPFVAALPIARFDLPQYGPNTGSHDIRAVTLDFSHDGLQDVLVLSVPKFDGMKWSLQSQVQFLKNLGGGQFSDVTDSVLKGYVTASATSYAPYVADFNKDGLLDIFLSESSWDSSTYNSTTILLQQSDGTFVDTARDLLSSIVANGGAKAALAQGPDHQYYEVVETPSVGGRVEVSVALLRFSLLGTGAAESLSGSDAPDSIVGLGGDDWIFGNGGDDTFDGGAGNDSLVGGSGNDTIDGSSGTDTAKYSGNSANYTVTKTSNGYTVRDNVGTDGLDTLVGIEYLNFSDKSVFIGSNTSPTGTVTISGTLKQGETLTAGNTLGDVDGLGTISYQWQSSSDGRIWTTVGSSASLQLTESLVGKQLQVIANYVDGHGTTESPASLATNNLSASSVPGTSAPDSLIGSSFADSLLGGNGNDMVKGGAGNDTIDGGAGIDTALYDSNFASYVITNDTSTGSLVVRSLSGTDGTDSLTGIERIKFADKSIAYDLDGNAGLAVQIICAALGKTTLHNSAVVGAGLSLFDSGYSTQSIAELVINNHLMGTVNNEAFVSVLWSNVMGSAIDSPTLQALTGLLDNHAFTQAGLLAAAAQLPQVQQQVDLVGLRAGGIEYQ